MSDAYQNRVNKGYKQFIQMVGEARAEEIRSHWNQISPAFEKFVLGVLAGEVWTRPELDLRTRSLATVAGLTALGRPRALALNIEMALRNGASRDEIRETILQMAFYAGFPAAWEGLQTADEVFQRLSV
ncbi:MAG: 4-carboxymuconolactone decarboxylase [Acidobacteria bacterium]|nr:MAG: 4-carboxymuconolactone decarboxylase [Acidobacteriota bacterium]